MAAKKHKSAKYFDALTTFQHRVAIALGYTEEWQYQSLIQSNKLQVEWTVGGMTGGNCWNDGADRPVSAEPEPEFEELDKILEELVPDITYLQYKKLVREIVEHKETHDSEYYGNYYERRSKTVSLLVLEEYLKEDGLYNG